MGFPSALLAVVLPLRMVGLAGWFALVIGVYFTFSGMFFGKRERMVQSAMGAVGPAGEGARFVFGLRSGGGQQEPAAQGRCDDACDGF
jgi:hypothetical protein